MTPPRIGDCVSVERHESQDGHRVHVYVHSFICCYFFLTTLYHERIVRTLLAHSLWSFDRFYLLRWTHFFSIYLFICLFRPLLRSTRVHAAVFDVTLKPGWSLSFSYVSRTEIFFALFLFLDSIFCIWKGSGDIFKYWWAVLNSFESFSQWTHLGACHALIITCISLHLFFSSF
jgi:hypothetical protein